jgi:hypothetical protein
MRPQKIERPPPRSDEGDGLRSKSLRRRFDASYTRNLESLPIASAHAASLLAPAGRFTLFADQVISARNGRKPRTEPPRRRINGIAAQKPFDDELPI